MIGDIINKKRLGKILSKKELEYAFNGYLTKEVKDYQMASLLMAICIKGMTDKEIFDLTDIFIKSGECLDFSDIEGVKVDKHSTGGIGDKTTLIITPIVASLGIPFIKMSGRGLGYTGGTIDKLESISGFRTDLTMNQIKEEVNAINMVVSSQTANLVPLDKKVYALRDVTATTESIPLIAVSIMSKKIACGADKILIDIKHGKGALLKTKEDAQKLSQIMIKIGKKYKKEVKTVITDMNTPLGNSIGNSLEVLEAINVLRGKVENNLSILCIDLASKLVSMAKKISEEEAKKMVIEVLNNGKAYRKFVEFVSYQKGDLSNLRVGNIKKRVYAKKDGKVGKIDALEAGKLAMSLGAGRKNKEDKIDYSAGIKLNKYLGETVDKGDLLYTLYSDSQIEIDEDKVYEIV